MRLAALPVRVTLGAVILDTTVLGQEGEVDNFAVVELAGGTGNGDGVIVGTGAYKGLFSLPIYSKDKLFY